MTWRKKNDPLQGISRHSLYEAAVQNVEADADFIVRVGKRELGRSPRTLREDFCGTAALASHWVSRHRENRAWGVDLHAPTLDWGRRHRLATLGKSAQRVVLCQRDVRDRAEVQVDVQVAFNFSYFVFQSRKDLLAYFSAAYQSLARPGLFLLDLFGGTESMAELEENTKLEASIDRDGSEIPAFTYYWDQASFNPIDHRLRCYIHFRLAKGKKKKRVFSYDWRFWTLPEIQELLSEAGFSKTDVYVEGWDADADEPNGIFRRRARFDNEGSWIAYVVAKKA